MLKTTIIIILLNTAITADLKKCMNITQKIIDNPQMIYPYDFNFTIGELKAGRSVSKKTISFPTTSNDKFYYLTIFPFLIQSDDRETFEEDLDTYFDKQKHKYANMVFLSQCLYYENEVTVVFLFTEYVLPLGVKSSAEVTVDFKQGPHPFNIQNMINAIDIASIIESSHKEGKISLMLSPQTFYRRIDIKGNVKYMFLENDYSLLTNNDNRSDVYYDPFILLKDFETNKCSDIYSLGMILNSIFYGELSFDDISACKLNTFNAGECAEQKYKRIFDHQKRITITNYNISAIPSEKYTLYELKVDVDTLIQMLIKPDCNKRLSSGFAVHELTKIYNRMKGIPKNPINYPIINLDEQVQILNDYINKPTGIIEHLFDKWNVAKTDIPKAPNNVNIDTKNVYPKANNIKKVEPQKQVDSTEFYHVPDSDIEMINNYGKQDIKAQKPKNEVPQFYHVGHDYIYQQQTVNHLLNGNNVAIQQYPVYQNTGYRNAANQQYLQHMKMHKIL